MGWCAVFERVEEEPETTVGFFVGDAEQPEYARLQFWLMNSDGTRTKLPPVEHEVVRLAANLHWLGFEKMQVVGMRLGKGVMAGLGGFA